MGIENSRQHRLPATGSDNFSSGTTDFLRHKKHRQMDRLRQSFSFSNKKKETTTPNVQSNKNDNNQKTKIENKPLQWQDDEKTVRTGTCNYNVKYLGSVEVQESRGMYVCEQAIQALLNQKGKHIKAILYISGDALRVVDETNKGLIVDQTIEKVSFCAPDRHHEKGFAYICRDGTTRRWLCHGFLSIKETGERLSHAVGCAFQICLERKQKRDRECDVTVEYTQNGTSFTKFGSFRTTSIAERIIDPQSAIIAEPVPYASINSNIYSSNQKHNLIERPRPKGNNSAPFVRSISMRSDDFNQANTNMFKRQTSLRPGNLSSIEEIKYKKPCTNTILEEEVESTSTTNELSKLSLFNSTNIQSHNRFSLPIIKENVASDTRLPSNITSIIFEDAQPTTATSLHEAFNSNLTALVQSNHPINPFSPYGCSIAAQAQSSQPNYQQSTVFTPKRGTNPFDDDLIRR